MNVWSPTTLSDQASFAYLWIANGPADALNVVQAGWGVSNTCHLFILLPKTKPLLLVGRRNGVVIEGSLCLGQDGESFDWLVRVCE